MKSELRGLIYVCGVTRHNALVENRYMKIGGAFIEVKCVHCGGTHKFYNNGQEFETQGGYSHNPLEEEDGHASA